jgi:hypothetical protein
MLRISGSMLYLRMNLLRIATSAGLSLDAEMADWLDEISTFNINARYDNYKQDFYKRCTTDFAQVWATRIHQKT